MRTQKEKTSITISTLEASIVTKGTTSEQKDSGETQSEYKDTNT
jgi:hypothetical protein